METNDQDGDDLLDRLYEISGSSSRTPAPDQYFVVSSSLQNERDDVRERAIFIGGLRWMDKTLLGYFKGALLTGAESSDNNRRLMIECLVSEAIERHQSAEPLNGLLKTVQEAADRKSLTAKSAYVGSKRLMGKMTKSQFAALDYDDIEIEE